MNRSARSPKASGIATAISRVSSISAISSSRTEVDSVSSSFVAHVVKFHDHQTTSRHTAAWPAPSQLRCSSRKCVICVIANTNTRS